MLVSKIKNSVLFIIISAILAFMLMGLSKTPEAYAEPAPANSSGASQNINDKCNENNNNECCTETNLNASNCRIVRYLVDFIRILSGLVGVVVVTMIVVGGIQYSAAADNPQAVAAARGRIINALIALVVYLFMFTILQYLVPGGIL